MGVEYWSNICRGTFTKLGKILHKYIVVYRKSINGRRFFVVDGIGDLTIDGWGFKRK